MPISKIKSSSVDPTAFSGSLIADGTVDTADLANDAVTSAKLDTNIAIDGTLTVDTDTLHVDATNNRIGVNTTSPAHALDIVESADAFGVRITNNSDSSQGLQIRTSDNDSGLRILDLQTSSSATGTNYASIFSVEKNGNVGINTSAPSPTGLAIQTGGGAKGVMLTRGAAGTNPTQGQGLGSFGWKSAMDGVNTMAAAEASIEAIAAETHSGSAAGTHIAFYVKPNGTGPGSAPTEKMRLTQGGKLLINTTTDNGFPLRVAGKTQLETGMENTFGQLHLHGINAGDAQIAFSTDSNGRNIYVDESDTNTMRFSGGYGKGHSSDFKIGNVGQVYIGGSLSKASGSFRIRHPLPEKNKTHWLVHSFVEGPQADNLYRGKVDLVDGSAVINIDTASGMSDGTFVLLNREVQCFTTNETGWTAIKGYVDGNKLIINAQDDPDKNISTCTDTISWMVIGERQDDHMKSSDTDWTDSDGKIIIEPELTESEKRDRTETKENPVHPMMEEIK